MIKIDLNGGFYRNGAIAAAPEASGAEKELGRDKTIAWKILAAHNHSGPDGQTDKLRIRFDALTSHDITYVGIVQTARASGMKE